jgi:CO/xanthine dehydrogenase FAD-binding subunit
MVGITFGHLRPQLLMDLARVGELQERHTADGAVRLGAAVAYTGSLSLTR